MFAHIATWLIMERRKKDEMSKYRIVVVIRWSLFKWLRWWFAEEAHGGGSRSLLVKPKVLLRERGKTVAS